MGKGIPIPFPFVDFGKAWSVVSNPNLFKGPEVSAKEGREIVAEYKRQYADYKNKGGSRSYGSWIKWKGYGSGLYDLLKPNKRNMKLMRAFTSSASKSRGPVDLGRNMLKSYFSGDGLDIHKAIGKLPKPKGGFTLPGHNYTGPYNPLEQQLKYDPNTGQILEIYQQPTGKTDAVSMQHDVDYSVCGNKPKNDQVKCKNDADRKMVKALDAIPWKERQWGHAVARNAIAAKSKLGMGVKKPKNGKSRRVKKTGKKN